MNEQSNSSPLRLGVVGVGLYGEHHAATYARLPNTDLIAVCDLDEQRAREAAERHGVPRWYSDAVEMMEKEDLDAVSIATPDHTHPPLVLAAIEAGLHVLCEKPLSKTADESARIVAAGKEAGLIVSVDFQNRANAAFVAAKAAIDAGKLGKVRHGYLRLSNTTFVPLEMLPWSSKSSALWFLGSHGVDMLRFLLDDEVVRVYAVKRNGLLQSRGVDTDDFHLAILEFAGGATITIEHSWILPQSQTSVFDFKVDLVGDEGALNINTSHSGVIELFSEDGMSYPDVLGGTDVGVGRVGGFVGEAIARFVDSVIHGVPPLASGEDGLKVAEVLEAVELSAASGSPVDL